MEEKELISLLDDISIDLRAEVVIADLIKKGFTPYDLFVKPVGLFRRRFAKDIAQIAKIDLKNNESAWMISVNREGLYDVLPQTLFHNPSKKPKPFKSVTEMVGEVKQRVKEEENARNFFFAYEIEFFRQRIAIEWQERKLLETITYSMDDEKILSYWDLPELLDERQKGVLFYLLPVIHKIRSNYHLMKETYRAILNEEVDIKNSGVKMNDRKTVLNFNTLGQFELSRNSILGKENYPVYETVLIEVGPLSLENIFNYLPGERNRKIISHLNSLFMPVEVETEIKILVPKKDWNLSLKNKNESRLGYSSFV